MKLPIALLNKEVVISEGAVMTPGPLKKGKREAVKLTIRLALFQAFSGSYADEQADPRIAREGIDGYSLYLRYSCANRIKDAVKEVVLSDEEVEQLRIVLTKGWRAHTEVFGFLCDALNVKPKKPEAK